MTITCPNCQADITMLTRYRGSCEDCGAEYQVRMKETYKPRYEMTLTVKEISKSKPAPRREQPRQRRKPYFDWSHMLEPERPQNPDEPREKRGSWQDDVKL